MHPYFIRINIYLNKKKHLWNCVHEKNLITEINFGNYFTNSTKMIEPEKEIFKWMIDIIINPNPWVFWLGTILNPPKSSSALLEARPYLQNAPCIFHILALMACTSRQVVILPHLKRGSTSFQKSAPWRILEWLGLRLHQVSFM